MKKVLLIFILITSQISLSQNAILNEEKIEKFIKVWGLLKYHHPEISRGTYNYNQEFIKEFEKIKSINTREKYNLELLTWIKKFGTDEFKFDPDYLDRKNLFTKNADFEWIDNSGFNAELAKLLHKIKNNTNYKDHYASINRWSNAVKFENEKGLDSFDVHNAAHRLLFLASFWNIMKYWNVNIYLTETPWREVLPEMIPEFSKDDPIAFEHAKEKLFSKLNDSHSNYNYSLTRSSFTRYPNFGGRIINDSLVVTVIHNDSVAKIDDISLGDVIVSIEGMNIKQYYTSKFSDVISASNENALKRAIGTWYLLASTKDSIKVGIVNKFGRKEEKYIHLSKMSFLRENYDGKRPAKPDNGIIKTNIGYLNLENIDEKELESAFEELENTKGIIIDLRNYPRNISAESVAKYLYPEKKKFIKTLTPLLPSYGKYDTKTALRIISNPFSAGKKNKNYYKGLVILLVGRSTVSMAEYFGMAIQASPNCITIGEQTAGAVMNRNPVPLIDNTTIDFTGAGAFYPNDQNVQRKGLKINFEIQENARNHNENLYIEQAIRIIEEEQNTDNS